MSPSIMGFVRLRSDIISATWIYEGTALLVHLDGGEMVRMYPPSEPSTSVGLELDLEAVRYSFFRVRYHFV